MALIPPRKDPTLEAIDRLLEDETNSQPKRDYIGASSIGDECSRRIWYRYHSEQSETWPAQTIRKFNDGHSCEARMADLLSRVPGVELWTHDENGKQYGWVNGAAKGHLDGIILGLLQAPKTPHSWEHKATNEKSFNEFKKLVLADEKTALGQWNHVYYAQAVLNMNQMGLTRCYMTVSTPGLRDYWSCRTEENPTFAKALLSKAERISVMKEPPERISKTPDYYICKMCNRKGECWGEVA